MGLFPTDVSVVKGHLFLFTLHLLIDFFHYLTLAVSQSYIVDRDSPMHTGWWVSSRPITCLHVNWFSQCCRALCLITCLFMQIRFKWNHRDNDLWKIWNWVAECNIQDMAGTALIVLLSMIISSIWQQFHLFSMQINLSHEFSDVRCFPELVLDICFCAYDDALV